jgi:hypothetical protein
MERPRSLPERRGGADAPRRGIGNAGAGFADRRPAARLRAWLADLGIRARAAATGALLPTPLVWPSEGKLVFAEVRMRP